MCTHTVDKKIAEKNRMGVRVDNELVNLTEFT